MTAPTVQCTALGCVIRPGHESTCLPRPSRLYLCTSCNGRGNSEWPETGWTCVDCFGTGLGS